MTDLGVGATRGMNGSRANDSNNRGRIVGAAVLWR
jgi:hypothetical protein